MGVGVSAPAVEALELYEKVGFKRWGTEPDALACGGQRHDEHMLTLGLST